MGRYINRVEYVDLPVMGKASALMALGAHEIEAPTEWVPGLVCVVENGWMDAAAYAFDEEEMRAFQRPDGRKKTWLIIPDAERWAT